MEVTDQQPWTTRTTTDRNTIREWADARGAEPAHVPAVSEDETGTLRFDFTPEETEAVEGLVWDAFFEKFDRENLAFEFARALEYDRGGDSGPAKSGDETEEEHYRFVHREETGISDVPDANVSVVAVETAAAPTDADEEGAETATSGTESAAEIPDRPEMESASGMNTRSPPDEADPDRRPELTAGLVVDEIHEDARGYDHWNENDEYLVFRNDGEEPLDLTGWRVENSDGKTYEFPDEFVLDPRRAVTVHSGSGEDTDEDLYWNSNRAVWKNTGDTLTVRDETDRRVIRVSY